MTPGEKSNLFAQLSHTLRMIDTQIQQVRQEASEMTDAFGLKLSVLPEELKDSNGQYLMTPLLIARAQVLLAITELKVTM